jgi:hypothetical protein
MASAVAVLRDVVGRAQTAAGAGVFCDCCGGDVVVLDSDGLSSCCACSWHRGLPRFLVNFELCDHARRQGGAVPSAEKITHVSAKPGLSSAPLGDADQVAGGVRALPAHPLNSNSGGSPSVARSSGPTQAGGASE